MDGCHWQRVILSILLVVGCLGCALPPQGRQEIDFVSARELEAISIVREGLYLLSRNRYVDAEFKLRYGLYYYPQAVNLKINLAEALKGQGNFLDAAEIYQELLTVDPASTQLLVGLAQVSLAAGNRESAIMRYEEALQFALNAGEEERAANLARSLASLYFSNGQEELAVCFSQQAVQFAPDREQILRHLRLLVGVGQLVQAETVINQYIEDDPGKRDADFLWQLALIEAGKGKFEKALELMELVRDKSTNRGALSQEMEIFAQVVNFVVNKTVEPTEDDPFSVAQLETTITVEELELLNTLFWPVRAELALKQFAEAKRNEAE